MYCTLYIYWTPHNIQYSTSPCNALHERHWKKCFVKNIHWIWIRIQNFGPIWIRNQGYVMNVEKKFQIILEKKQFSFKKYFFKTTVRVHTRKYRYLVSWAFERWIFVFILTHFAFILSHIFICWSGSLFPIRIRIHKGPEYGSNTGQIRIHNSLVKNEKNEKMKNEL